MAPLDPAVISGPSPFADSVRTCPWSADYEPLRPDPDLPPVSSLPDLFQRSAERFPKNSCLGWRPSPTDDFTFWTFAETRSHVDAIRCALQSLGLSRGDRVGIYARNCPQWAVAHYALVSAGLVLVPIYDTLGPDIVEFVCNHSAVKLVFSSATNFSKLRAVRAAGKLPTVRRVVVIGERDFGDDAQDIDECVASAAGEGDTLTVGSFLQMGRDLVASAEAPAAPSLTPDDTLVIMYTSGTTGNPKGVVLTHRNFIASVSSVLMFFRHWKVGYRATDVYLSYLPLSHIFEQQSLATLMSAGARIGFFSGDVKLLLSDLQALSPTLFAGVPRVFARFQQRIEQIVERASTVKRTLFGWAYARQLRAVQNPGEVSRVGFWDTLVFNAVRAGLMPDVRLMVTGSAPMSEQTNDFFKVCLMCPVVQGYGLTETMGGVSVSVPLRSKSGTVGGPMPGAHVKLRDLPEMGYLSSDEPYPRGEVCVKGDNVFKGYHENAAATKEAFDEDGFFRTGDVGQWLPDGSLQIIDRAKNLFKLSQGEYVSPEALEQEYAKARLVGQIFVYGNSLQSTLVAVVVPDVGEAKAWGISHGLESLEAVAESKEFTGAILEQLEELRVKYKFKKYEAITKVVVDVSELNELGQGFHVENNLMTPSFKLKRPQLKEKYGSQLESLYEE